MRKKQKKQIQNLLLFFMALEILANAIRQGKRVIPFETWGKMCHFLHIVMLYLEKKRNHWKTFINIEGKIQ